MTPDFPSSDRKLTRQSTLDLVATSLMIGASLLLIVTLVRGLVAQSPEQPEIRPAEPLPEAPLDIQGAPLKGNPLAPVVMVEFSEFECPYCGAFARETLKELDRLYIAPGKLQVAFRHFPLTRHKNAVGAALAAVCANTAGRFWAMHDLLFTDQRDLGIPSLYRRAGDLGLNHESFEACMSSSTHPMIEADVLEARRLGLKGTPAFFLGRKNAKGNVTVSKRLTGSRPLAQFIEAIDALLR